MNQDTPSQLDPVPQDDALSSEPQLSPEEAAERDRVLKGSGTMRQLRGPMIFLAILMAIVLGYQFLKPRGEPVTGNVQAALAHAGQTGKPIIMAFTSPQDCPPCVVMENKTWPDETLQHYIKEHYVLVKLNPQDQRNREWMQRFGVKAFPTTAITSAQGELIRSHDRLMYADEMLNYLKNTYEHAKAKSKVIHSPATQPAEVGLKSDVE